jgi:hypothetical protein
VTQPSVGQMIYFNGGVKIIFSLTTHRMVFSSGGGMA